MKQSQGGEENKWWVVLADRSVSYHPSFARLAGSVAAGVLLSQAIYWQLRIPEKRPPGCPGPGWFWKSSIDWEEETALSRKQQEAARARLVQLGVLQEKRCGVPARMFFSVDLDRLENLLKKQPAPKNTSTKKEKKEEGSKDEIKEYLRLGLAYGGAGDTPPHTPGGWLYAAKKRIQGQGGLSGIDRGQLKGWAKKERGVDDGADQKNSGAGSEPQPSGGGIFSAGLSLIQAAAGAGGGEQEDEDARFAAAGMAN